MRVAQARLALNQDGAAIQDGQRPMTQGELGDLIGRNRVTVNKIEAGAARVSRETLERLSVVLGRSTEWLLGEPEQVDEFEIARERLASAAGKIADGFQEVGLVLDLVKRAREAGVLAEPPEVEA